MPDADYVPLVSEFSDYRASLNKDYAQRLREAAKKLDALAGETLHMPEQMRLAGKAEGVRLALSYLEEWKRTNG